MKATRTLLKRTRLTLSPPLSLSSIFLSLSHTPILAGALVQAAKALLNLISLPLSFSHTLVFLSL